MRSDEAAQHELAAQQGLFARRLLGATPRVWATQALLAVTVLVFLVMLADGAGLMQPNSTVHLKWGANFGPATKEGGWWRLAAAMFLHFGALHLAFNMWALWSAGRLVERLFGSLPFIALYVFAGLTGGFASLLWNADKVVSAGASGAVFGVYGALAGFMLRERGSVPRSVLKGLAGSTLAFVAYSLFFGALVAGIDNAAHVGGLAGGFALGWLLARPLLPRPPLSRARSAQAAGFAAAALAALFALLPPAPYAYSAQQAATAAIQAFAGEERELARKAAALVDARREGRIDDAELGARIEGELVPGWNAAYARFAAIRLEQAAPAARPLRLLTEYLRMRRDMFVEYAAGTKGGDRARINRADALAAESQKLLQAMRESAR